MRIFIPILLLLTLASPALASDGVLEINQVCAIHTGCFSGDAPGWPVTIDGSAGRSYRLTSDLIIPNALTTGIEINTNDVGIDLNNFAIVLSFCVAMTTDCTPLAGTGSGIKTNSRGISVKNGSITGMGNSGVDLGVQAEVRNLRVRWNRIDGVRVSGTSVVSGITAVENGDDGIDAPGFATISNNSVVLNGDDGIDAGSASSISDNVAGSNEGDGIECGLGCVVRENSVRQNGGYGLNLNTHSAYSDNVVTGNAIGTVTGAGSTNSRGGNFCAGTGTVSAFCP